MNYAELKDIIVSNSNRFRDTLGGCPIDKSLILADLIINNALQYSVEIGVYKGGSFFPQAWAYNYLGTGKVIGIDPYQVACAKEENLPKGLEHVNDIIDRWDCEKTYLNVWSNIFSFQLSSHAYLIRSKAEDAYTAIPDNIDMLHVDGNHDTACVKIDIARYLPKVKKGGIIVLDDTNWPSVACCLHLLHGCEMETSFPSYQIWRKLS